MQPNVLSLLSELINIVIVAAYTNCLTLRKEEEIEWGCKAWVKKKINVFLDFLTTVCMSGQAIHFIIMLLHWFTPREWDEETWQSLWNSYKEVTRTPPRRCFVLGKTLTILLFIHTYILEIALITAWSDPTDFNFFFEVKEIKNFQISHYAKILLHHWLGKQQRLQFPTMSHTLKPKIKTGFYRHFRIQSCRLLWLTGNYAFIIHWA